MKTYIVIPVHNRKALTKACLASFDKQIVEAKVEIIIVDDGSTDGTSDMIKESFPKVTLLQEDGDLWWVGSINKGIQYALDHCHVDDYILVINDDLVVPENYLSALLAAASANPKAIIGSVEVTADKPHTIKNGGHQVNWMTAKQKKLNRGADLRTFSLGHTVSVSKLTGRGTLFPSRVFREVGLYDNEHFKQSGDTELPSRAYFHYGYQLYVCYDAVVISYPDTKTNINTAKVYMLSDFQEYFFGLRSHFNLKDHYWFARKIAPNTLWFMRFVTLEFLRNVYHYVVRLRFQK